VNVLVCAFEYAVVDARCAVTYRTHLAQMRTNGMLGADVDIETLARDMMKNYSGAEIEGIVKAATSFALTRQVRRRVM
jgi:ATP-dependent 26S proteasome regulatory subunit